MCGIAGMTDLRGVGSDVMDALSGALDHMRLRGPDGAGLWHDDRCALGHRRLAIIDLSEGGRQPMLHHGYAITFNGEIYNHEILREELEGLGHVFASRSDTEVILAGWRQWGEALLPRLSGMFALAIWDPAAGDLVLATDRFGKKPLVYTHDGDRLAFASDLRALRTILPGSGEIDQQALKLFFSLRFIPAPWTIYSSARKLPAGYVARFSRAGLSLRRWDDGAQARRPVFTDRQEAIAALRQQFDRAVGERLVADVPVGAFLSGGIDSAIVCASLAAQGRQVRSFTVGFTGAAAYYEERPAARRVARHLGLDHIEVDIDMGSAADVVDEVLDSCDEPFADSSALPVFLLSRETRRHVTVALSGDGADEIFAGYRKYQGELAAAHWQRLPALLRRGIAGILAGMPESKDRPVLELLRRARRFALHGDKPPAARQAGWMSLLSEAELQTLLPGWQPEPSVEGLVMALRQKADGADLINQVLSVEQSLVLGGDMLRKVDLMSMANSLEVRCPFLDRGVTDVAAAIPGNWKLQPGRGKAILREAFADRLPPDVFRLPKKGFEMPIASWLRGGLRDRMRAASDPVKLQRQGLIHAGPVQEWVDDLESGRRDTSWQLWALMAFQAWAARERLW
ncbi:asparagine synthase (glutamine-hydrolyzing) [Ferrovibrio sp.]|uniref:asparagine synthase (glutamine-hydrolyzing) n=1 Tax=Ferrovibrio sp. TaxID=1917215 RepID=UPI003512B68E